MSLLRILRLTNVAITKRHIRKYNLNDFLDTTNEEELLEVPEEEEPTGPTRVGIIPDEEDDELEPGAQDAEAYEDLDDDDYGMNYSNRALLIF